jgi:RNA polymerase sigma factor (sigma-70 family)
VTGAGRTVRWNPGFTDDEPCVERLKAGDGDSMANLFRRYSDDVFRFCGRRTEDWTTAEDLVSVVFLEAWRGRARAFVVDGSARPWLLGIANNVARNARRSLHRYGDALARYHAAYPAQNEGDFADEVVNARALDRAGQVVADAMRCLPRSERDVAELCLVGELTVAAAAAALGIPAGTAKSRLGRARRRLQRAVVRSGEHLDRHAAIGHSYSERHVGASGEEQLVGVRGE